MKDSALEEIKKQIDHIISNSSRSFASFSIVDKSLGEIARERGNENLRKSLNHENSTEIDENIADSFSDLEHQINTIFTRHSTAISHLL